jgi:hypothetical protein
MAKRRNHAWSTDNAPPETYRCKNCECVIPIFAYDKAKRFPCRGYKLVPGEGL